MEELGHRALGVEFDHRNDFRMREGREGLGDELCKRRALDRSGDEGPHEIGRGLDEGSVGDRRNRPGKLMGHEESPVGSQPVEQDVTETFAGHTASGAAVHQRSVVLADH